MSGRSSTDHTGYVLKAYYSSLRLIQVAVENASIAWKEIQKLNALAEPAVAQDKEKKTKQPAAAASVNESGKKSNMGDAGGRGKRLF